MKYDNIDLLSGTYHTGKNNFNYFIGYVNYFSESIKPLLIKKPKLNGFINGFGKVKYISFILNEKHDKLLSTYSKILSKDLFVEVIHKNKYIETKVKSYNRFS